MEFLISEKMILKIVFDIKNQELELFLSRILPNYAKISLIKYTKDIGGSINLESKTLRVFRVWELP